MLRQDKEKRCLGKLEEKRNRKNMIQIVQALYKNKVRTHKDKFIKFTSKIDLKEDCFYPLLFSIVIDKAIRKCNERDKSMKVGSCKIERKLL